MRKHPESSGASGAVVPHVPHARHHVNVAAILAIGLCGGAWAQQAAPKDDGPAAQAAAPRPEPAQLEQVVITARKRVERVLDVPASVKAFSARTLEDAQVTQITDFIGLTPNASIVKSQSAGISFITIRGLSQVRNGEPPVAMVVDGVQVPNSKSFTQDLFDLQSVQIMRGPQGAIYGRNAPGGAILLNTKLPSDTIRGFVQVGAGTGSEKSAKAAVSGAIVPDELLFRVGVSGIDREGYFDNVHLGQKQDPYKDTTVNTLLRWMPSEELTLDGRVNASRTRGGANNFVAQNIKYDAAKPCFLDSANPFGGPAPDPNRYLGEFCSAYVGQNDRDVTDFSLKADYQTSLGTLTGIVAYNHVKEFEGGTQYPYTASINLFGGVLNGTQTQFTDDKAKSFELRLASPTKQGVRWMGGVYFLRADGFISTTTGFDNGTGIPRLTRTRPAAVAGQPSSWLADTRNDKSSAVFGNIAADIADGLEASAGFRYDRNTRRQNSDPALPDFEAQFNSMQPTASLRYKLNSSTQVYATAGKGFRAGQFNQSGAAEAAAAAGTTGVHHLVGSETTRSVELGFKSEFDNVLRIEGSVFKSQVKGQQYFLFIPSISAQVLANIDKVNLEGGEIEVAAAPASGFDVYAGLGYTRSRIGAYELNPAAVGNWAPYVPRVSLNLGAQYRFSIGHGLMMMTRADFISKGKQYWDPENAGARNDINLVNLRVGLEDEKRKWSLLASVVNATDKKYNEEFVAGGFATPANPRVVRLDFRVNF